MTSANQAPDELTLLRELVSTLQKSVSTLEATLKESQKENSLLRQKIDALCRRIYGSSSEKIDSAQLELLLKLASQEAAPTPEQALAAQTSSLSARPRKEKSPRVPENLPVVEQ